jgi:hypothetical protein
MILGKPLCGAGIFIDFLCSAIYLYQQVQQRSDHESDHEIVCV